jgi:Leucine-rich repeat (LRR) protein
MLTSAFTTKIALLCVLALGAVGCSKSLKTLAEGDGKLADDAKAVVAALKGSGIEAQSVRIATSNVPSCDRSSRCAEVGVLGERIVALFVNNAKGFDLAALGAAKRLQKVRLRQTLHGKVVAPTGLDALERLELGDNSDLKSFQADGLKALRQLSLSSSGLERLELSKLPSLERLSVDDTKLTSLTLKTVGLRELRVASLATLEQLALSDLPRLHRITVQRTKLRGVKLSKVPLLSKVELTAGELERLALSGLPKLQQLDLARNKLKVVELKQLPLLSSVNLQRNKLTQLPTISAAPALKVLRVGHNQIASLAGIEQLQTKTLYVAHNALTSLDPTVAPASTGKAETPAKSTPPKSTPPKSTPPKSTPPKGAVATTGVETLIADHNKLVTLGSLAAYPALVYLAVDHNKLTSLAGVERAPKLKTLRATHNKLETIEGGEKLPKLRLLYVSHNQLVTLKPLDLAKLHTLYADHNKLARSTEIFGAANGKRPKIKRYDLRHNLFKEVAATLLVYGLARAGTRYGRRRGGRYRAKDYRRRGGYRYRGSSRRIRNRGSRYSRGGGGYRSGK